MRFFFTYLHRINCTTHSEQQRGKIITYLMGNFTPSQGDVEWKAQPMQENDSYNTNTKSAEVIKWNTFL